MPWSNQSGGGGGGGGGPWGGGGGNGGGRGPWGGPPGGGNQPPDLEQFLRRGGDRLRQVLPSGGDGRIGGRGIALIVAGLVIAWALTGWYRVQPDEVGVNMVFGRFTSISPPGLNYNWPYPIGEVQKPRVTTVNSFTVGTDDNAASGEPDESLMLTGDQNIVDINFQVQWTIKDAAAYLFNIENQEGTVRAVAESAMREVVGQRPIQPILTNSRATIQQQVRDLMQKTLDGYHAGVNVSNVQLLKVDPPQQVVASFRDVIAAQVDSQRLQNEAQTYASRVVPEARGQASRITQAAEAYRDQTVAEARGQAAQFTQVEAQYRKAPAVTRERLYLETMESVLAGMDKVLVDTRSGVVPYLPLDGTASGAASGAAAEAPQAAGTGQSQAQQSGGAAQ